MSHALLPGRHVGRSVGGWDAVLGHAGMQVVLHLRLAIQGLQLVGQHLVLPLICLQVVAGVDLRMQDPQQVPDQAAGGR